MGLSKLISSYQLGQFISNLVISNNSQTIELEQTKSVIYGFTLTIPSGAAAPTLTLYDKSGNVLGPAIPLQVGSVVVAKNMSLGKIVLADTGAFTSTLLVIKTLANDEESLQALLQSAQLVIQTASLSNNVIISPLDSGGNVLVDVKKNSAGTTDISNSPTVTSTADAELEILIVGSASVSTLSINGGTAYNLSSNVAIGANNWFTVRVYCKSGDTFTFTNATVVKATQRAL